MNRLVGLVMTGAFGLAVLAVASPSLVRIEQAAVPLALVIGILVGVLRVLWFLTR